MTEPEPGGCCLERPGLSELPHGEAFLQDACVGWEGSGTARELVYLFFSSRLASATGLV